MSKEISAAAEGFDVFQDQVNITLFNDIINFVTATTAMDSNQTVRKLSGKHLWYSSCFNNDIQSKYGFRYFGELLERFEDKAGSDIKDIRAIALAMANTNYLLTDDMFVGGQRVNFVKKITRLSADDLYLKGALYLLAAGEPHANGLLDDLAKSSYSKSEELLFVLSLHDDFEQGFRILKPQLIKLLGVNRTMTADGNANIYCWLVKQLHHCSGIKEIRTKDMALFRALMELPVSFIKTGGRHHGVLLDNGYSAEEIIFLNSYTVRRRPITGAIEVDSIVGEKIAVETCKILINSENTHSPVVYEHLEWLVKKYDSFNIKINGWQGIYKAIENDITLVNPRTFLWLFKLIQPRELFRFDILDEKWDILSRKLDIKVYLNLFNRQLENNPKLSGTQMQERIKKYEELTGSIYQDQFKLEYEYGRDNIFDMLVKKGVINLISEFESYPGLDSINENDKNGSEPPMLVYIRHFIRGIHHREAFGFFQYFFREHDFEDMHRLFTDKSDSWGYRNFDYFFIDAFYKGDSRYHNYKELGFDIKRSFLSDDEHRTLFGWLDDYMFKFRADKYTEFAVLMLVDPFIATLFPKTELRGIYDLARDSEIKEINPYIRKLKEIFLSEAELQAEREADDAHRAEVKRQEKEQHIQALRDSLTACYDGTFKSLLTYLEKYRFDFRNEKSAAMRIAAGYLETALTDNNYTLNGKELGRFLQFAGKLIKNEAITFDCFKHHILKVKEETEYAENNGAPETDPNA